MSNSTRWRQKIINVSFVFLLVINASVLIVLWFNPISILENEELYGRSHLKFPGLPGEQGSSHTFLGPNPRTFFADLLRASNISIKADNAKYSLMDEALFPYSAQFVYVKEIHHDHLTPFGISMVHQLHCLRMLNETLHQNSHGSMHGGHTDTEHLEHCVDYIAQSIVCAGDDTLEPSHLWEDPVSGKIFRVVDGTGTVHQCRDTRILQKAFSESYKAPIPLVHEWKEGATLGGLVGEY